MTEDEKAPTPNTPESSPAPPELDDDLDFGKTALQFFIIPAFVVALCVGVFVFFAWLVSDEKTGVDYLNEVRAGSTSRRWQAAFELSKIITMDDEKRRMEGLVPKMVLAFEEAETDDPRVRDYLALSLGHLADAAAVPALVGALGDEEPSTRLYSAWALGSIGDPRALDPVLALMGDNDVGVRKMAVYALGALGDDRAIPRLRVALSDPERDVSWNAAIALAQLHDTSGEAQLLQMLDESFLEGLTDMNASQKLLATQSAIQAAAIVGGETLTAKLQEVADAHANLVLREEALSALAALATLVDLESAQALAEP